jgi:predicted ArsR family transcriptional regulator
MTDGTEVATPAPEARHRALAHRSRVRLLDLVRAAPEGLEAAALADRTGLHPNTVRLHLATLEEAGLVQRETVRRGGRGRPAIRYLAVEPGDEDGHRLLAAMLATALSTGDHTRPSPAAEGAGRRWGRHLAAGPARTGEVREEVTGLFDRLGFAPAADRGRLVLHDCPYRDLARRHPDVVCGLHLGLLRGALEERGAPADDAWLEPFVTPTRCIAGFDAATAPAAGQELP